MIDLLELERDVNGPSTNHETFEDQVDRVQGQAWGRYASLRYDEQQSCVEAAPNLVTFSFAHAPIPSGIVFAETVNDSYQRLTKFSELFRGYSARSSHTTNFVIAVSELTGAQKYHVIAPRPKENRQTREEPEWTDEKNERRCTLVDKEIDGTLSSAEKLELEELQGQMLAYRRKVAPLPLKEAQQLHQYLLKKAAEQED